VLECVVNVSEGRDLSVIRAVAASAADHVLDVHSDPDHNRSVVTLAGPHTEDAVRALSRQVVASVDISRHSGVHPRLGALDVVPFVALDDGGSPVAVRDASSSELRARDEFATWAGGELDLPCFCYGPERSLPEVRRRAFVDLLPDYGPLAPHPTAGSCAVGARPVLVAYNLWLSATDLEVARSIARAIRNPQLRALGLSVSGTTQVSCNLLDPLQVGPRQVYDAVRELAIASGVTITRAELVGLAPQAVVEAVPPEMRELLDLDTSRTIEARLAEVCGKPDERR